MNHLDSIINDKIICEDIQSLINSIGLGFIPLSGKTILVTGADGFIPSYFVDTILFLNKSVLIKNPAKLVILTHHNISKDSRLSHCLDSPSIDFLVGDVSKLILPDNVDIIIHGASKASPKDYLSQLIETADVNVLGTKKLLDYCVNHSVLKFLFISTGEIYGDPAIVPTPETYNGNVNPIGPRAAYQESKRFAETLCSLYNKSYGIDTVIARLFHTYGPRLSLDDGRVIPEFTRKALQGENIKVVDIPSIRTFSYISDSIEAMWRILLLGKSGQAYNVGSEEEISMKSLAGLITSLTGNRSKVEIIPSTSITHSIGTPLRTAPRVEKIKKLGQYNKYYLEQGLMRLIRWYKNHEAQKTLK